MSEPVLTGSACVPIPCIQLRYEDQQFKVCPPAALPAAFEPLELPPLVRSTADRLALLSGMLWAKRRRSVGLLLFLDAKRRCWGYGTPFQRSGPDASTWTADRRHFPQLPPEAYVAGSFQSRVMLPGESPIDAVPPKIDGVHLVFRIEEDARSVWTFVTMNGEPIAAMPDALIVDDLALEFGEMVERLSFI